MYFHTYAMPQAMGKIFAVSSVSNNAAGGGVHFLRCYAGFFRRDTALAGFVYNMPNLSILFRFFIPMPPAAGNIGAIAIVNTAKIHQHRLIVLKFAVGRFMMRVGRIFTKSDNG